MMFSIVLQNEALCLKCVMDSRVLLPVFKLHKLDKSGWWSNIGNKERVMYDLRRDDVIVWCMFLDMQGTRLLGYSEWSKFEFLY